MRGDSERPLHAKRCHIRERHDHIVPLPYLPICSWSPATEFDWRDSTCRNLEFLKLADLEFDRHDYSVGATFWILHPVYRSLRKRLTEQRYTFARRLFYYLSLQRFFKESLFSQLTNSFPVSTDSFLFFIVHWIIFGHKSYICDSLNSATRHMRFTRSFGFRVKLPTNS